MTMANGRIEENEETVMHLLNEKYFRSDIAAQMLNMHKNTLLEKAREGKIRSYHHKRWVWVKEAWIREYLERESR